MVSAQNPASDSDSMDDHRFPKSRRVLRGSHFTRILQRGRGAADGTLVVHALPSQPDAAPRLGVTIPRKTGNAVVRNRWKRWIREAFRTQQSSLPRGYDFIVRPKKDAVADGRAVKRSLPRMTHKAARASGQSGRSR